MATAKAKNVPKILNNTDLKAKDFQKERMKRWLGEEIEEVR